MLQLLVNMAQRLLETFANYTNSILSDGSIFGPWQVNYAGFGSVQVTTLESGSGLELAPAVSKSPDETHACLVTGHKSCGDIEFEVTVHTHEQLRTGSPPNEWEVGWVCWNYTDDQHFYYFHVKHCGWELGKEDPRYPGAQRFLATGTSPCYPIGQPYRIRIIQRGATIEAYVDGEKIAEFTDEQEPYLAGKIGMYCEDSRVGFSGVEVVQ
jgi:hypothetical protein